MLKRFLVTALLATLALPALAAQDRPHDPMDRGPGMHDRMPGEHVEIERRMRMGDGGHGDMMAMMARRLGFTEAQKKQFQAMHLRHQRELLKLQNEKQLKALDLRELMMAEELNQGAITGKLNELNDLERKMTELKVKGFFEMRNALTPEQRKKLPNQMLMMHLKGHGR